ncbi:hypothetical protein, partial [Vibrio parahaemolyticus]|uniref:hypothetical protein n=1 Tax=Vibrio parahaemolyticus TaxID=670 RepID=UPI002112788D
TVEDGDDPRLTWEVTDTDGNLQSVYVSLQESHFVRMEYEYIDGSLYPKPIYSGWMEISFSNSNAGYFRPAEIAGLRRY